MWSLPSCLFVKITLLWPRELWKFGNVANISISKFNEEKHNESADQVLKKPVVEADDLNQHPTCQSLENYVDNLCKNIQSNFISSFAELPPAVISNSLILPVFLYIILFPTLVTMLTSHVAAVWSLEQSTLKKYCSDVVLEPLKCNC